MKGRYHKLKMNLCINSKTLRSKLKEFLCRRFGRRESVTLFYHKDRQPCCDLLVLGYVLHHFSFKILPIYLYVVAKCVAL